MVRNAKLRDMKLRIDHRDRRHVEFAVFGLPFWGGTKLMQPSTGPAPTLADGCEFWRLEAAGPEFSRLPLRA